MGLQANLDLSNNSSSNNEDELQKPEELFALDPTAGRTPRNRKETTNLETTEVTRTEVPKYFRYKSETNQ